MPGTPSYSITQSPTNAAQDEGVGPTAALDKDPYSISQLRYPLSGIGTTDVPSYVVFYINLPTTSKYFQQTSGQNVNTNSASTQNYDTLQAANATYQPGGSTAGQFAGAEVTTGVLGTLNGGVNKGVQQAVGGAAAIPVIRSLNLKPKLQRIKQSIAIYMPDTVQTSYSHKWDSISATDAAGDIAKYAQLGGSNLGAAALDILKASGKNFIGADGGRNAYNSAQSAELAGNIAESLGVLGAGATDLLIRQQGVAVNPHVEMLFRATSNRNYVFTFDFIPRSQQESVAIYNIIKTFKAFAAPEVSAQVGGRYFIPPAQFDIQYYFMSAQNQVLNKISTCALTDINVNYSGQGAWATFNDGMPLHIQLVLNFTEMDIMVRELITKEGY